MADEIYHRRLVRDALKLLTDALTVVTDRNLNPTQQAAFWADLQDEINKRT